MSDNLALWNAVQTTDPKATKQFSRGGGFRGTATNATYLAKKATEQFGPCGIGWGVTVLDERLLDGAPIGDGVVEKVHRVHIKLWYKLGEQRGEVEHFGQTTFAGKNKNGYFTDEEAPKKSLTDAMTKALSLLGFAADIHLGLYDDSRYVADLKREAAAEPPPGPRQIVNATSPQAPPDKAAAAGASSRDHLFAAIEKQPPGELLAWRKRPDIDALVQTLDDADRAALKTRISERMRMAA